MSNKKWQYLGTKVTEGEKEQFENYLNRYNEIHNTEYSKCNFIKYLLIGCMNNFNKKHPI